MKIAISAVLFSNDTLIGAQRPRALAACLARRGHEVTVFAPQASAEVSTVPPEGITLVELPDYAPRASLPGSQLPLWQRLVVLGSIVSTVPLALVLSQPGLAGLFGLRGARLAQSFDELNARRRLTTARVRSMLDAVEWVEEATRAMARQGMVPRDFDAILSTYGPFGSPWFGNVLAKMNPHAVRIVDIRDAIVKPNLLRSVRSALSRAERRLVRSAHVVSVVSDGVRNETLAQRANRSSFNKIFVLPNGFSRPGDEEPPAGPTGERPLRIGYTGQIYEGSQDPRPLFQALAAIRRNDEGARFEVHYAGRQGHLMRGLAEEFSLTDAVVDHGFLSHGEALALQERMDILLVLSWNRRDSQGIISGKFGEYLAREKPILALISGDIPGAELGSLIASMNVGHACEEAAGETGQAELTEYLRLAAAYAAEGAALPYAPVAGELDKFDYDTITAKLEGLIEAARTAASGQQERR